MPYTILVACGSTSKAHWVSKGEISSPFSATLYEENYDSGKSIIYTLRFQKKESGPGGGWFVKKNLDGDNERGQRPSLIWTTPKDLTVIVHTKRIYGNIVQKFSDNSEDDGSLTLEYRADRLSQ